MRNTTIGALAVLVAVSAALASSDPLLDRIDQLERELRELKSQVQQRNATPPGKASEPAPPVAPRAETPPPAAEPAPRTAAHAGEEPGYRAVIDRIKLGAYGSIRYEGSTLADQNQTFTFRRFVLTADANIAPRLHGLMELEFERFRELELEKHLGPAEGGLAAQQTVEGTDQSEISFEQAWLQYDIVDWLKFRGGAVLVPLGRFNLNHDDNLWNLPRRSLVDRGASVLPVPAAWDELGVGFLGDIPVGGQALLNYQAYVVNGASLDFDFEQVARSTRGTEPGEVEFEGELRPATGTFGSDVKDAKALTGRLAFSPSLGQEVGASGYFGQYTPDFLGRENLWSLALDGLTTHGPFALEGEYVYTRFEGIGNVARQLARVATDKGIENESPDLNAVVEFDLSGLARTKHGYWLEGRYTFWPEFLDRTFLKWKFDNPQLVAVLRGEQVWFGDFINEVDFSGGRLTALDSDDRRLGRISLGLAYRPIPLVAFQLAYEYTQTNDGKSLAGVTNFLPARSDESDAHAVLVGAAFGF